MLIKKIMGKVKNWVNKKAAIISLALANVEKNAFSQTGESLSNDVNQERRHTQGQLADSLVHGEITQEVINLRWRTYKILKESDGHISEVIGYDDNNMPIVKSGGQIVVNMKAPEAIQEKKEIDYDAIFTRSFQAVSSLLTITLLIKQL
jgi:hypothetical protein